MSTGTEGMAEPAEAERALAQARATGDPRAVGGAESYLGASYQAHGRLPDALAALRAAERTFATAGLAREAAISRINVARILSELGRGDEAVAGYEAVSREVGLDRGVTAEVWRGIVEHFQRLGQPDLAVARLQEAAGRLEAEDRHAEAGDVLMYEGSVHHAATQLHQAADCFARAATAYDTGGDAQGARNARHNLEVLAGG